MNNTTYRTRCATIMKDSGKEIVVMHKLLYYPINIGMAIILSG